MKNQLSLLKYLIFFILCAGMQWVHAQTYRVDIVSGNSQVNAYPNQQPQAFIARAVDTVTGLPVPNVLVVWAVNGLATATPPPTGTLSYFNGIPVALGTGTYSQTTDANGEISMLFTPGFNLNMGIAICPGAPPIFYTSPPCITFGLSLNPAAQSVKVVLVSGTPQNSTSPNPQPLPFVAQAIDPLTGAVVPNASLYWQVGGVTGNPTVPPNTATVSFNGSTFGWAAGRFNTTTDTAGNSQVSFASSYNNPQIVIACPSAVTLGTGNCATYTVNAASIAAINRVISVSALSQVNAFPNAQAQAFVARLVDGTNQPIANTGVVIDAGIPNAPVGTTTGDVINGTPVTSAQPINGTTDAAGQISITYRTGSATARYLRVCPVR